MLEYKCYLYITAHNIDANILNKEKGSYVRYAENLERFFEATGFLGALGDRKRYTILFEKLQSGCLQKCGHVPTSAVL